MIESSTYARSSKACPRTSPTLTAATGVSSGLRFNLPAASKSCTARASAT